MTLNHNLNCRVTAHRDLAKAQHLAKLNREICSSQFQYWMPRLEFRRLRAVEVTKSHFLPARSVTSNHLDQCLRTVTNGKIETAISGLHQQIAP